MAIANRMLTVKSLVELKLVWTDFSTMHLLLFLLLVLFSPFPAEKASYLAIFAGSPVKGFSLAGSLIAGLEPSSKQGGGGGGEKGFSQHH